nr:aldehyde dehydrogenase family protein [Propionicimonas sp.]
MNRLWIDGRAVAGADRDTVPVVNPGTEEVVGEMCRGTAADANAAVDSAAEALRLWRRTSVSERAAAVRAVGGEIRKHTDELAEMLTLEGGKPLRDSRGELDVAARTFEFYASLVEQETGRVVPSGSSGQVNLVVPEPYGVTACIVPWNFPIQLLSWKAAPALASGNTIVALPSPFTPFATVRLAELAAAHLPPGVFNVVTGLGPEAGEALVQHPSVRHVAFTGSVETGRHIAVTAAGLLKKVTLELGGKDPLIVGPDMDLTVAAQATAFAGLLNAGQCCTSTERVYVDQARFEEFTEVLADLVSGLRIGPGTDPTVDLGPMISRSAVDRVADQVAAARAGGARIVTGGRRPESPSRGFFYEPTVVVGAAPGSTLMTEEVFGPVLPLDTYRDFEEAIAKANDSEFGLGASLMSNDPALAKRFMEGVEAGTVYINDPLTPNCSAPFGGTKNSGLGRELGLEGLNEFRQSKHVHWDVGGDVKSYWPDVPVS